MALVWDLDNEIIDREEKYVLLAYTDHADHDGKNMFPSIELICNKTGYKERSVQAITRSLEEKGFLKSWLGGATQERGGRSKRYYEITQTGKKAVTEIKSMRDELWTLSKIKLSVE